MPDRSPQPRLAGTTQRPASPGPPPAAVSRSRRPTAAPTPHARPAAGSTRGLAPAVHPQPTESPRPLGHPVKSSTSDSTTRLRGWPAPISAVIRAGNIGGARRGGHRPYRRLEVPNDSPKVAGLPRNYRRVLSCQAFQPPLMPRPVNRDRAELRMSVGAGLPRGRACLLAPLALERPGPGRAGEGSTGLNDAEPSGQYHLTVVFDEWGQRIV